MFYPHHRLYAKNGAFPETRAFGRCLPRRNGSTILASKAVMYCSDAGLAWISRSSSAEREREILFVPSMTEHY